MEIEIGANVTDDNSVGTVLANVTYPNSTIQQIELSNAGGDKYNYSFTIPYLKGKYNVTFIANDSWNNVNDTETTNFTLVDDVPPRVVLIHPWGSSCAGHYHDEDSDVDITVDVTDPLSGVDTILANITFPNQTLSINLSGFHYGLQSDDFETNSTGVNWSHANTTLAVGQSCYTDINETYPGKMFIALDGGVGPQGMDCAYNSIKRTDGNYDLNLSFDVIKMEDDTYFTLRSAPTDSLSASGLRVYISLIKEGGKMKYRLAYYNGTATYKDDIPNIHDTSGKFRIRRSNMTGTPEFNLYYWDGSWVESKFGNISLPGSLRTHFIQIKPGSSASNFGALNVTIDAFNISGDTYKFAIFNQTHDNGTYNVTIIANDTLGNVNDTVNSSFNITYVNDPPSRPFLTNPDPGDNVTGLFKIQWQQVTDDEDHKVRFNITLLNPDGSPNSTIVSDYGDINTYSYQWDTTAHPDGLYSMKITVYENETAEGRSNSDTLAGNFTIDNPIVIDVPKEASPVYRKGGEQFWVNFTYKDANPKNYTVTIYNSSATINLSSDICHTPNSYKNVSFNLNSTAADGWYNVSVEMYDNSSNYNISYQNNSVVKVTWESYSDSAHTAVCNDFQSYASEHTVYMFGEGFRPNTAYRIIFWDDGGAIRKTESKNSNADGNLSTSHTFVSGTDQAGTWYATVYYPNTHNPGSHDPNDPYLVADDTFEVADTAIPEFPEVVTAIAVCMLCAISYMVMRRKVGKR
jgi:hypothetical protein